MLIFRFKALTDNDSNTTTWAQQTHNNFNSVEIQLRHIRLLFCYCCICNNLISCNLSSHATK
jgi:hypothetical protein